MNSIKHFDSLPIDTDELVLAVTGALKEKKFEFHPSFNLRHARTQQKDYPCFYHGTENCSCQMVVLQIYRNSSRRNGESPITLVLYGQDDQTQISFIESQEHLSETTLQECLDIVLDRVQVLIKKKVSV